MGGGGDEDPDERVPFEWVLTCDHRATQRVFAHLEKLKVVLLGNIHRLLQDFNYRFQYLVRGL